jgi:hypothetical protein
LFFCHDNFILYITVETKFYQFQRLRFCPVLRLPLSIIFFASLFAFQFLASLPFASRTKITRLIHRLRLYLSQTLTARLIDPSTSLFLLNPLFPCHFPIVDRNNRGAEPREKDRGGLGKWKKKWTRQSLR